MDWKLTEPDYPQIDIEADHVLGVSMWLEKMIDMTGSEFSKGDWNVMIADIWPNDNYSRLIGLVQMNEGRIGYDTGYRVCAYISKGGIVGDSGDDAPLIKAWLNEAVKSDRVKAALERRTSRHRFEIRLSSWGEGPINGLTQILFEDASLPQGKPLKPSWRVGFLLFLRNRLRSK